MANLILNGSTSGSVTLSSPAVSGTTTLTLPTTTGTILTTTSPKAGNVIQVVSATKTDTFSTSSTSFTDVTGLSVSITPTSASSKIFITYSVNVGWDANRGMQLRLMRDSTAICVGDAASDRSRSSNTTFADGGATFEARWQWALNNNFLDSPTTTSATTYKIQIGAISETDGTNIYVNRSSQDGNAGTAGRTASTITVMEIAA